LAPRKAGLRWLTLAFSLPMQPAYARVKIWRHLQSVGAIAIGKSGLYVLPATRNMLTAFEWVLNEARSVGGDAAILESRLIAGFSDEEICRLFQEQRDAEFDSLVEEIRALKSTWVQRRSGLNTREAQAQLGRFAERAKAIAARDFFPSGAGADVTSLLGDMERVLERRSSRI
jgi:hypothetical protein